MCLPNLTPIQRSVRASLVGLPQEIIDQIVELLCRDAVADDVAVNKIDPDAGEVWTLMDLLYPPMDFDPELAQQLNVICLAMTCSYFFRLLAPKIYGIMIRAAAPWSSHRLIMVGDYVQGMPHEVEQSATDDEISRMSRDKGNKYWNPLYEWARKPENKILVGNRDLWVDVWTQTMDEEDDDQEGEGQEGEGQEIAT